MLIPKCDHNALRYINNGLCPLCDVIPRPDPSVATVEVVSAIGVSDGQWRKDAASVLAPIIAALPDAKKPDGSPDWPKLSARSHSYRAPPVGMRVAVKEVADTAERKLSHIEVQAERCKRSLAYFVRCYWPVMMPGIPLHWNWHLTAICDHVQKLCMEWMRKQRDPTYRMKAQNLAINCPPRSLKSTIVSVCAPAWMWLNWPSWKAMFVSANPTVATRDSRACRQCLESSWYHEIKSALGLTWDMRGSGDTMYGNTEGGVRLSSSFKAIVVGLGADAIFVDDPNDAKKSLGEKERANVNDTWDLSLCNRVNDYSSSIRIMIMQRVHEMDLTGHWRTGMPAALTVYISIPLEFDPDMDEDNRKSPFGYHDPRTTKGENLHPARFTPEVIEGERLKGDFYFSGQMNQSPVPAEGGAFKRESWNFFYISSAERHHHALTGSIVDREHHEWRDGDAAPIEMKDGALNWEPIDPRRRARVRPKGCNTDRPAIPLPFLDVIVISADTSFGSKKETASRVAIGAFGFKGALNFLIENRTRVRSVPETKQAIRQIVKDFPAAQVVIIERKASGHDVCEELRSDISGVVPIDDNASWIDRANGMLPSQQAGQWYLLEGAQWTTSYVSEHAMFPNGANDDQIDMTSQVHRYRRAMYGGAGSSLPNW